MKKHLHFRMVWPMVSFGMLLAISCLFSIAYIQHLQTDLTRTIDQDVRRLQSALELKVQLRTLRFDSVICAAHPTPENLNHLLTSEKQFETLLNDFSESVIQSNQDFNLIQLKQLYNNYRDQLGPGGMPNSPIQSIQEMIDWASAHPVRQLISPCDNLIDQLDTKMQNTLQISESQTAWTGRLLLFLGIIGSLGGVLSGYALARGLSKTAAQLSVRVQAAQEHLDQKIGTMHIEASHNLHSLDKQLEYVVERVREVCQKLQEQERDLLRAEQLAAVGQLAAGVAHEIRNPITGVKLLVDHSLMNDRSTPLTKSELEMIREEILRVERTIQGLLDFARAPTPNRQVFDIRNLIQNGIERISSRAKRYNVKINSELPDAPLFSEVDADQFTSMLTNLVINAIEESPRGSYVQIDVKQSNSKFLEIAVSDNGPGIPSQIADRLFTPFSTTKTTGTGLGLTIAQRIAREHGGDVTAVNRHNGGACFTILLPYMELEHAKNISG